MGWQDACGLIAAAVKGTRGPLIGVVCGCVSNTDICAWVLLGKLQRGYSICSVSVVETLNGGPDGD
jgi:hypothetical protein